MRLDGPIDRGIQHPTGVEGVRVNKLLRPEWGVRIYQLELGDEFSWVTPTLG